MDITAILAQFLVASLVYFFMNRERADDKDEIKQLKSELKEVRQGWLDDLRDWSGVAPRFQTWVEPRPATRPIRIPDIDAQTYMHEQEKA